MVTAQHPYPDVAAILRAATLGLGLHVRAHAELRGASVVGPRAEAYVLPAATSTPSGAATTITTDSAGTHRWQVDLWRPGGRDPYRIARVALLAGAVRFAVAEVLDPAGRRAWLSQWPA